MSAPFAACQTRLNRAVLARLSNAQATLAGGTVLDVVFDAAYSLGDVGGIGMASTAPQALADSAALGGSIVGQSISIGGASYLVTAAEPDSTGLTRLLLESAA